MITLHYVFDELNFDYEIDRDDFEKGVFDILNEGWTKEELIEYLIDNDGCRINLLSEFESEVHDHFESEAEEHYNDCKTSDNGVDDGDFV